MSEISIAYLGPEGTNCHEAAGRFASKLPGQVDTVPCATIDDIFSAVDRARCTYGVVPMENSLEGPVTASLDNFAFKSQAIILGELVLEIHHCLLVHPDAQLQDIEIVASHPQGLAQCRRFLSETLPGRSTLTTTSTAESAKIAVSDKTKAGIGTAFAAELYGARVFDDEIGDRLGNQTSFACIGRPNSQQVFEGSRTKTSLALFLRADKAGALLMILSEFAYANINLTKIQSRPTKQALGDYMFFVDIEGDVSNADVQTALNCLRLKLREVKVIGSFPLL